jgi:hypothetical protein
MSLSRRHFLAIAAVSALPAGAATIPRPAADISINLPGGKKLPIKQFRGKLIGLTFINTG